MEYIRGIGEQEIRDLYFNADISDIAERGRELCSQVHGDQVLLRGLIEYSNFCRRDCLYCGIRNGNKKAERYRLTKENILRIVEMGFERGLRTFVLQSGEDSYYRNGDICRIVEGIRKITHGEAAVTLSCGIFSRSQYREMRDAGAERYLIRFETSDPELHRYLRDGISLKKRLKAIEILKEEGFQTGSGFMLGLPGEADETRIQNILLAQELEVDMAGIGPFIPHGDTPLGGSPQVPIDVSLRCTGILRLALPYTHIPATTAAGSLTPRGREMMISAGANVLMPNLTPPDVKKHYLLYPGKICLSESGMECIGCLAARVVPLKRKLGFQRGDAVGPNWGTN